MTHGFVCWPVLLFSERAVGEHQVFPNKPQNVLSFENKTNARYNSFQNDQPQGTVIGFYNQIWIIQLSHASDQSEGILKSDLQKTKQSLLSCLSPRPQISRHFFQLRSLKTTRKHPLPTPLQRTTFLFPSVSHTFCKF